MLHVEPYNPRHLLVIDARNEQSIELAMGKQNLPEMAAYYALAGPAYTISEKRGIEGHQWWEPIFCGGVVERNEHSASLWGVFSERASSSGLYVFNRIKRFIDKQPHTRLDAWVNGGNERAERLVLALGFVPEGTMSDFFAPGTDANIFRRAA